MTCEYASAISWRPPVPSCILRNSADYRNIDPRYGSLEDWDRLVKAMHERGLKMMYVSLCLRSSDYFADNELKKDGPGRKPYF